MSTGGDLRSCEECHLSLDSHEIVSPPFAKNQTKRSCPSFSSQDRRPAIHATVDGTFLYFKNHLILSCTRSQSKVVEKKASHEEELLLKTSHSLSVTSAGAIILILDFWI